MEIPTDFPNNDERHPVCRYQAFLPDLKGGKPLNLPAAAGRGLR